MVGVTRKPAVRITEIRWCDSSPGNQIEVADYFMPYDYDKLYNEDLDLGSGTPLLLPTQSGAAHPNLLITGGKEGTIYLLNRDNLGKYHPDNDDQILQSFSIQSTGVFNAPIFWNSTLYYGLTNLPVQAFAYDPGHSDDQYHSIIGFAD